MTTVGKVRVTVVLTFEGPDWNEAEDCVEAALDAGSIQDAIMSFARDEDRDVELTSAVVTTVEKED